MKLKIENIQPSTGRNLRNLGESDHKMKTCKTNHEYFNLITRLSLAYSQLYHLSAKALGSTPAQQRQEGENPGINTDDQVRKLTPPSSMIRLNCPHPFNGRCSSLPATWVDRSSSRDDAAKYNDLQYFIFSIPKE